MLERRERLVQFLLFHTPMQDSSPLAQSSQRKRRRKGLRFSSRKVLQQSQMRHLKRLDNIDEVTCAFDFDGEDGPPRGGQIESIEGKIQGGGKRKGRKRREASAESKDATEEGAS